jgi:hypothetical protein
MKLKVKKKQKLLLPSLLGVILQYTTTKDWFAFDLAGTISNLLSRCSGQLGIRSNQFARSKATVLDWTASLVNSINRSQFRWK